MREGQLKSLKGQAVVLKKNRQKGWASSIQTGKAEGGAGT